MRAQLRGDERDLYHQHSRLTPVQRAWSISAGPGVLPAASGEADAPNPKRE